MASNPCKGGQVICYSLGGMSVLWKDISDLMISTSDIIIFVTPYSAKTNAQLGLRNIKQEYKKYKTFLQNLLHVLSSLPVKY